MLLHMRARALQACGHAGWRKCGYCKRYDDIRNLSVYGSRQMARHAKCGAEYQRRRRSNSVYLVQTEHGPYAFCETEERALRHVAWLKANRLKGEPVWIETFNEGAPRAVSQRHGASNQPASPV